MILLVFFVGSAILSGGPNSRFVGPLAQIARLAGRFGEIRMWTRTKYRGAINVILLGCLLILAPISELAAQTDPAAKGLPVERESLKVTSAEENVPESLHPLAPAVRLARETAEFIDRSVQDYTCNLVMRERIKGRLKYHEVAHLKVRRAQWDEDHLLQPFESFFGC